MNMCAATKTVKPSQTCSFLAFFLSVLSVVLFLGSGPDRAQSPVTPVPHLGGITI